MTMSQLGRREARELFIDLCFSAVPACKDELIVLSRSASLVAWLRDSPVYVRLAVTFKLREDLNRLRGLHITPRVGEPYARVTRRTFDLLGRRQLLDGLDKPLPRGGAEFSWVMRDLAELILKWQRRWNLEATWLALECLRLVVSRALELEGKGFGPLEKSGILESYLRWPGFVHVDPLADPIGDSWNPLRENRTDARKRLMAKARKVIDTYLDEVAEIACRDGIGGMRERKHLEWLVWYQVRGDSVNSMAKRAGRARATVQTALEETARFLGIPLRDPGPIGRPRKIAD